MLLVTLVSISGFLFILVSTDETTPIIFSTLLNDGEPIKLVGTGSTQHRDVSSSVSSVSVTEQSIYPVTPNIIKKIASASEVKVKIKGQNEFITGEFSEQCFKNFRRFVNEVI